MSYVALATDRFDEMDAFYRALGGSELARWDRPGARGARFDVAGLQIELLDHAREERELRFGDADERVHLVLEVDDVDAFHARRAKNAPAPRDVSWGARLFELRDPDGTPITVVERRP